MTVNSEDAVQAALLLEHLCIGMDGNCNECPLFSSADTCMVGYAELFPYEWDLEEKLSWGMHND